MLFDSNGTPIDELKTKEFKAGLEHIIELAKQGQNDLAPLRAKGGILLPRPEDYAWNSFKFIISVVENLQKLTK